MSKQLRAVVVGAGWAGEGHTRALQSASVQVEAICARNLDVVKGVAKTLDVPEASVDWRRTMERVKPEIVAIATPASLRRELVEAACALGCHMYCDKPLATTAAEARQLYSLAQNANVKHAYAATGLYGPVTFWLRELLQQGRIGQPHEVMFAMRLNISPLMPWSWLDSLSHGGGALNNVLPHLLGTLETCLDGKIVRVKGEAQVRRTQAPIDDSLHDIRAAMAKGRELTEAEAQQMEWRTSDSDGTAWVLLHVETEANDIMATVVLDAFRKPVPSEQNGLRIYGERGTLIADFLGPVSDVSWMAADDGAPETLPIPQRILDGLPDTDDPILDRWCALARDFVADVRGESHRPYLTFYDGWRYQEAIDAIRANGGYFEVPR